MNVKKKKKTMTITREKTVIREPSIMIFNFNQLNIKE